MTIREYNYQRVMDNGFSHKAKITFIPKSTKVKCVMSSINKSGGCIYDLTFEVSAKTLDDAIIEALSRTDLSVDDFTNDKTYCL